MAGRKIDLFSSNTSVVENPKPQPLDIRFRGFSVELDLTWEPEAIFHGAMRYRVSLGSDAVGNMIRLDNALSGFPGRIADTEKELESLESSAAAARIEIEKPFPYADEPTNTSKIDTAVRGNFDVPLEFTNVNDNGLSSIIDAERYRGNDGRNDEDNGVGRTGNTDSGQSVRSVKPRVITELTDSILGNTNRNHFCLKTYSRTLPISARARL